MIIDDEVMSIVRAITILWITRTLKTSSNKEHGVKIIPMFSRKINDKDKGLNHGGTNGPD
jgi:hypothetical protein